MCLRKLSMQLVITKIKCNYTFEMITVLLLLHLLVVDIRSPCFSFLKLIFGNHRKRRYDLLSDGYINSNIYLLRDSLLLNFINGFKSPCFLHRHSVRKGKGGMS